MKKAGVSFDPKAFLAKIGEGQRIDSYRKDQIVFSQGEPADAVFYIQKGKVKITVVSEQGKEAVIAMLGSNDFFGEGCLAGQPRRMATVGAMTDSTIMRLEKASMIRLIHDDPAFSEMFIAHLLARTIRVEEDLIDQLFNSSEKRLARLLLLLANFGKDSKPEPVIAKISQETLAEMIGTTRARVSFFMNKFRKLGFIDYNGGIEVHSSLLNVILHDQPQIKAPEQRKHSRLTQRTVTGARAHWICLSTASPGRRVEVINFAQRRSRISPTLGLGERTQHAWVNQIEQRALMRPLCRKVLSTEAPMLQRHRHFADDRTRSMDFEHRRTLAQAIVDTVREPLLVLDKDLRVVAASRSFYLTFRVSRQDTQGQLLYALGDGQWDIPGLRTLLEKIVPEHAVLDDYEVEHEFPAIGHRVMLLNARKVFYEDSHHATLLLAIEDITGRRAAEREVQELLHQKELLLDEMQHRIANSLQIIASILLLKASSVQSEEIRSHLQDAHKRVLSVAAVQQHLHASGRGEAIAVAPYLSKLCATLAGSMISDDRAVSLEVVSDAASLSSTEAVSIGLIVTEGVLNALKHAFPPDNKNGRIVVTYKAQAADWKLSIADNGIGRRKECSGAGKAGLGTSIVNALAEQLNARVDVASSPSGTTVSVTRTAVIQLPHAA